MRGFLHAAFKPVKAGTPRGLHKPALHGHTGVAMEDGSERLSWTCDARSMVVRTAGAGLRRLADVTEHDSKNGSRLLEPLGYVPPAEFEKAYHDRQAPPVGMAVHAFSRLTATSEFWKVQALRPK